MTALRCWRARAARPVVSLQPHDTAPQPEMTGYGAVVVRWTVRG